MTIKTWHVVSISKIDGHNINGKFIANDFDTVLALAKAVHPLIVTHTPVSSEYDSTALLDTLSDAYTVIDPQDYIDSIAGETK